MACSGGSFVFLSADNFKEVFTHAQNKLVRFESLTIYAYSECL